MSLSVVVSAHLPVLVAVPAPVLVLVPNAVTLSVSVCLCHAMAYRLWLSYGIHEGFIRGCIKVSYGF